MVLEVAQLSIKPGKMAAFLAAMEATGSRALEACAGCLSARALGGIESPDIALLLVEWESLEAHAAARTSPEFGRFHEAAGAFFGKGGGSVEHYQPLPR